MANKQEHKEVQVKSKDTVQATLSVTLINETRKDSIEIYGRITGRFGIKSQFVLFDKPSSNPVSVKPGHNIPLNMSKVNVPPSATDLEITADLYDCGAISPDIDGKAVFLVRQPGETSQALIPGMNGNVFRFDVLWG